MENAKVVLTPIRNGLVAMSFLLLSVPLAAQVSLPGWPVQHFDNARTNFNPNEILLGPSNLGQLTELWSFTPCGYFDEPPAIASGVAYVVAESHCEQAGYTLTLYALNARTGSLLWQRTLGTTSEPYASPYAPTISGGLVYVGSCSGMSAFDAGSGALLWQNNSVGCVLDYFQEGNGVAAADGLVYFSSSTAGAIYALDATTGAQVWSFVTHYGAVAAPAVAGGVVYEAGLDGPISALDAHTGAVLWQATVSPGEVESPPAIVNGVLYVGGHEGGINALDAGSGALVWMDLPFYDVQGGASVAYGNVYINMQNHDQGPIDTYALNAETGATVWQIDNIGGFYAAAIANGVVYVVDGAYGAVHALDARTGASLKVFGGPIPRPSWSTAWCTSPTLTACTLMASLNSELPPCRFRNGRFLLDSGG